MVKIVFTKHANDKFKVLKRHGIEVSKAKVMETLKQPELVDKSRLPLLIAQSTLDQTHVLRVVYKQVNETLKVITFYPGRKKQYEKRQN